MDPPTLNRRDRFEQTALPYLDQLYRVASRLAGRDEARDLVQETVLRAFRTGCRDHAVARLRWTRESRLPRSEIERQMGRVRRAFQIWLIVSLAAGCGRSYDHTVSVVECDGTKIEAIERYRQAAVSGHTGFSRAVLVVSTGSWLPGRKEIDVTPVDTVDLSPMEGTLPAVVQWRKLAPHDRASRRVYVSPKEFTAEEFATVASCLARHGEEINRGFSKPRAPVESFDGDVFRGRWAGLRSVVYEQGVWSGNPCQEENTSGFRFECSGAPFFFSVDGHGYVRFCEPSEPGSMCGRVVGRVSADGSSAVVRSPDMSAPCAQGAFEEWIAGDWTRFYRECRLPSGQALGDLLEIRESESLE